MVTIQGAIGAMFVIRQGGINWNDLHLGYMIKKSAYCHIIVHSPIIRKIELSGGGVVVVGVALQGIGTHEVFCVSGACIKIANIRAPRT